ncbi:MAG: hypothetical protein NZ805_16465, partial [Armatimonadetes bacterium]|nr:hypothetical protein [Armatimonadota bacterium]
MKLLKGIKFRQEDRKDFCKTEAKLSLRAWLFATAFSVAISLLVSYFDLTMPQAWLGITALPIASFAVL